MSSSTAHSWSYQTRAALERLARRHAARWEANPTDPANLIDPLLPIVDRNRIAVEDAWGFCAETIARDLVGLMEEQRAETDES